jgi:hypothetical protein
MGFTEIDELDCNCDLNRAIRTLNYAVDAWKNLCGPIEKYEKCALKCSGMEKVSGANAKHILCGVMVSVCTDKELCEKDKFCAEFKFLEEKPWLVLGPKLKKWDGLTECLPKWIEAYLDSVDKIDPIMYQLEDLPDEIPRAIESAPGEFADLPTMKKAKACAQAIKAGKQAKDLLQELKKSAEQLKKAAGEMKEALEQCKKDQESGKFFEHGETCRTAGCVSIKDCYEKIYGPIPKGEKKAGEDAGCCTIF